VPQHILRSLVTTLFATSTFILALSLSWVVLAQANFLYPLWHDVGGIGAGIDQYGPQNRYKPGFGDTSKAQRSALFAEINRSVHEQGKGLEKIQYETPSSDGKQFLLRRDEVVHLQDVAKLIDLLSVVSWVNAVLWLTLACYQWRVIKHFAGLKNQVFSMFLVLLVAFVALMIIGPVKVFNQLHIWVFPGDHQWFFYYQDSLMSTLMLAPNLFGWIAAALIALAVLLFLLLTLVPLRVQKRWPRY